MSSQTPYETLTTYKPGGASIWITNMENYKNGSINDVIGRWSGIIFRFKSRKITVITVYQPPEGCKVKGTTNVIAQQRRWYIKKRDRNSDNKRIH
jgi:hypothetical protein